MPEECSCYGLRVVATVFVLYFFFTLAQSVMSSFFLVSLAHFPRFCRQYFSLSNAFSIHLARKTYFLRCSGFFGIFFLTLAQSVMSSLFFSFSGSFSSILLTVFFSQHRIFHTFSQKDVLFTVFEFLEFLLTFLLLFCVHEIKSLFAENHCHFLKFCC